MILVLKIYIYIYITLDNYGENIQSIQEEDVLSHKLNNLYSLFSPLFFKKSFVYSAERQDLLPCFSELLFTNKIKLPFWL